MSSASEIAPAPRADFLAGLALAVAGSILFSAKAVVVKLAYRYGVDATTLIALRMLCAAPIFALACVWAGRGRPPLARADHARLVVLGLVGYYAASYLDFLGLQYVTAAFERVILYLYPTLVLLLSALFLGTRITRADALALVLAYAGILLVFWHDLRFAGGDTGLGAGLVFASAASYALYLMWSGEIVRRIGAIRLTSYAMLVSTAAVTVQFFAINPAAALIQPPAVYWLSIVNGLVCTVLPVFATMSAVERIGAGSTSLAGMAGPVATIFLAWVFLGEAVTSAQVAGTALVLAGVFVLSSRRYQR